METVFAVALITVVLIFYVTICTKVVMRMQDDHTQRIDVLEFECTKLKNEYAELVDSVIEDTRKLESIVQESIKRERGF